MQEQNENTNLFLKKFYYEISCYNLPLFTLFCTKSMGSAQPMMTHKEKKNGKKHFCHWSSLDHVLSIKTFTDKKNCLYLTVCVPGLDNKCCPASHSTYFSHNPGQRAFAE